MIQRVYLSLLSGLRRNQSLHNSLEYPLLSPPKLAIVRGDIREIERQDEMALLHPDTSKILIWRRRPTRMEHPIEAWRAWGVEVKYEDDFYATPKARYKVEIDAYLRSVAADCRWDGPVMRSHKRPVDPKYWDSIRNKKIEDPDEYYSEMRDTLELAGVWAVKTQEAAVRVAGAYDVPTYGRIKLWGRVAQFELGYRAEACMIDELWLRRGHLYRVLNTRNSSRDDELIWERIKKIATALENRYQCKVNFV